MKRLIFLFLIFLVSCSKPIETSGDQCTIKDDCAVAGCSNQLCVKSEEASGIITTCEFKPEYNCLKYTSCTCNNGYCKFEENEEYTSCMDKFK
ncbi:MAG: eight-cysteine-cluster domain-containing protein [Candidatus Nanoarchaeia archaeon]|nr:eight-cysteine-cluster domain-containing protein [Candidatus Nanoarchaeia archaeon]